MRVDELMRSLMRRPVALVLIVVVAAAGAWIGYSNAASSYQSSATVLVVPPKAPDADGSMDNPFTRLDFSTAQLALVVATQLDSDAVRDRVVAAGGSGQYDTDTLSGSNSATAQLTPQVSITATAATAEGARASIDVLTEQASAQLAAVQSASTVPFAARADIVVSSPATAPALVGNPQVRAAGVFGIAAGFLGLLVLVASLPLLERRTRRRAAAAAEEEQLQVEAQLRPEPRFEPEPQLEPQTRSEPEPTMPSSAPSRTTSKTKTKAKTKPKPRSRTVAGSAAQATEAVGGVPGVVFAAPALPHPDTDDEASDESTSLDDSVTVESVAPGRPVSLRRQEILRQMVRDDYRRSGSTVAWSRAEQRAAYLRAEEQLAHTELLADREGGTISHLEDYVAHRDHG